MQSGAREESHDSPQGGGGQASHQGPLVGAAEVVLDGGLLLEVTQLPVRIVYSRLQDAGFMSNQPRVSTHAIHQLNISSSRQSQMMCYLVTQSC